MGRTEQFEQAELETVFEAEREPNHKVAKDVTKIILEVTPVAQQGFDSMGTYIDGDW